MKRPLALFLASVVMPTASGACWVVGALKGQSGFMEDEYAISSDAMSGQTFEVTISEKVTGYVPMRGMKCSAFSATAMQCANNDEGQVVLEAWTLDLASKKVIYTQNRSGYGLRDGGKFFIGDILEQCAENN